MRFIEYKIDNSQVLQLDYRLWLKNMDLYETSVTYNIILFTKLAHLRLMITYRGEAMISEKLIILGRPQKFHATINNLVVVAGYTLFLRSASDLVKLKFRVST